MNQLAMIGLNPNGLSRLLATRFYKQIVQSQLEYGLATSKNIWWFLQILYKSNATTDEVADYDRACPYTTSSIPLTISVIAR
ncbi:uncharacterized protein RHIMIDRAFT_233503 [Rhizopus microsporus ATCC 52813]|uniref:Uncharacterized protein n=1 Tax=Rhizopus microsporus ATCC 52813 TaxID=1340429 RepID=A0A2G4T5E5_RHIZD|nr:uncharacterized protein RHIMIDRAFT_233503 [Rhizopus microsporus ATCC 52813]PHZ15896.1 hypothetical protein RHIMIDRAFT_233503 [Rhizopus microsporus ATCC 52813]